jgi:hypothetical protein
MRNTLSVVVARLLFSWTRNDLIPYAEKDLDRRLRRRPGDPSPIRPRTATGMTALLSLGASWMRTGQRAPSGAAHHVAENPDKVCEAETEAVTPSPPIPSNYIGYYAREALPDALCNVTLIDIAAARIDCNPGTHSLREGAQPGALLCLVSHLWA